MHQYLLKFQQHYLQPAKIYIDMKLVIQKTVWQMQYVADVLYRRGDPLSLEKTSWDIELKSHIISTQSIIMKRGQQ